MVGGQWLHNGALPKQLHTSDEDGVEPKRNGLDQQLQTSTCSTKTALAFHDTPAPWLQPQDVLALKV